MECRYGKSPRELRFVRFEVRVKGRPKIAGTVNRKGAMCVACKSPVPFDHVRQEGQAGRMAVELMAIVGEGSARRLEIRDAGASAYHREVT